MESQDGTIITHRSPTFTSIEIGTLIDCIEKYKITILNKSNSTIASKAKEATWKKIANDYNSHGYYERNAEGLKMKWDNLKKTARKISKNLLDMNQDDYDELTQRVVQLMYESEKGTFDVVPDFDEPVEDEQEDEKEIKCDVSKHEWTVDEEKPLNDFIDEDKKNIDKILETNAIHDGRLSRSLNFSPKECSLLLQCVRSEKKIIFCKNTTAKINHLKSVAWQKVTMLFNSKSRRKRSLKVLQTKFNNMKKMTKQVGHNKVHSKISNLKNDTEGDSKVKKKIKKEPLYEVEVNLEPGDDEYFDEVHSIYNSKNGSTDPLSTVLNGDDSYGDFSLNTFLQSDNQAVVNLKLELLKHQIETAKIEQQRLKETMEAEKSERESRNIEQALRIRAARLEAVAAENKLPTGHPALNYTPDELCARPLLQ